MKRFHFLPVIALAVGSLLFGGTAASAETSTENFINPNTFETPKLGDLVCTFTGSFSLEESSSSTDPDDTIILEGVNQATDASLEYPRFTRSIVLKKDYAIANKKPCQNFVYGHDTENEVYKGGGEPVFKAAGYCGDKYITCKLPYNTLLAVSDAVIPDGTGPVNCLKESESYDGKIDVLSGGQNIKGGGVVLCGYDA